MQRVILVVSPDADFLQQIHSHLEEGGRFQVTCAASAHDALTMANSNFYEVVILDGEIDDIPLVAFSRDLAALQTELKILLFPPDNNPNHPLLEGLTTNGYLTKPFSGPEIGQALSKLFSDQPTESNTHANQVDELMKQWLEHPATGEKTTTQILKATTAQAVLLIIKEKLIASAGSINDNLVSNVIGFLSRYWKEDENSELIRFLKMVSDNNDLLLYTTKLVGNVLLVLIYPYTTTIQQVRGELNQVKSDFQKNYPTIGELRQEIAERAIVEIRERNKTLEALQSPSDEVSQSELDALNLLLDQSSNKTESVGISDEELANRALADIQQRNKALESLQPKTGAISQNELDALKLLNNQPKVKPETIQVSEQELTNLNKILSEMPSPDPETPMDNGTAAQIETEDVQKPDWMSALEQSEQPGFSQKEPEKSALIQEEKSLINDVPVVDIENLINPLGNEPSPFPPTIMEEGEIEPIPEIDFKLPWETEEVEQQTDPVAVAPVADATLEAVFPAEIESSAQETLDKNIDENISFGATLETATEKSAEESSLLTSRTLEETVEEPLNEIPPPIIEKSTTEESILQPLETNEEAAPSQDDLSNTQPPELKDFRFNYTCILIPDKPDQFLTRDLSEKLSVVMPQFHLAQGWKLTSITIRPQYMLWTVSVSLGVCAQKITHDIRGLTSAHIFANFPDIAKKKTSDDFWSSSYLVISGSEPPPVNLIFEFVAQIWKNHETTTP